MGIGFSVHQDGPGDVERVLREEAAERLATDELSQPVAAMISTLKDLEKNNPVVQKAIKGREEAMHGLCFLPLEDYLEVARVTEPGFSGCLVVGPKGFDIRNEGNDPPTLDGLREVHLVHFLSLLPHEIVKNVEEADRKAPR